MLMHGYHANGGCGLPRDEEGYGEKCGTTAERIAGKILSQRGLIRGKGKMVISSMSNHSENDTKSLGSKRRRCGRWIHLNRSYSCGDMRCRR